MKKVMRDQVIKGMASRARAVSMPFRSLGIHIPRLDLPGVYDNP